MPNSTGFSSCDCDLGFFFLGFDSGKTTHTSYTHTLQSTVIFIYDIKKEMGQKPMTHTRPDIKMGLEGLTSTGVWVEKFQLVLIMGGTKSGVQTMGPAS